MGGACSLFPTSVFSALGQSLYCAHTVPGDSCYSSQPLAAGHCDGCVGSDRGKGMVSTVECRLGEKDSGVLPQEPPPPRDSSGPGEKTN